MAIIPGMIQSMVMMRQLPGARQVAFWVIGLYGFTTAPRRHEYGVGDQPGKHMVIDPIKIVIEPITWVI